MAKVIGKFIATLVALPFVFLILLPLIVFGSVVNGWVLTKLWAWYAIPLFHVRPILLIEAMGIGLLISFLTHQHVPDTFKDKEGNEMSATFGSRMLAVFVSPFMVLFVAWIYSYWMPTNPAPLYPTTPQVQAVEPAK